MGFNEELLSSLVRSLKREKINRRARQIAPVSTLYFVRSFTSSVVPREGKEGNYENKSSPSSADFLLARRWGIRCVGPVKRRNRHNAVIDDGALPLDLLEQRIDQWIEAQR